METGESVHIERLIRRKNGRPGEELEVFLSDASSFFAAMRVWEDQPFHEGDRLTQVELNSIRDSSSIIAVRARAMALLAHAEHSRFLLRQKLLQRGCEIPQIEIVLDGLQDSGLLDDARFAASWVRSRIRRHPEGRVSLVAGLRQRGVDSSTSDLAVDKVLSDDGMSIDDVARSLAERLLRKRSAAEVSMKMIRRGFNSSAVRRIVTELAGQDPADLD